MEQERSPWAQLGSRSLLEKKLGRCSIHTVTQETVMQYLRHASLAATPGPPSHTKLWLSACQKSLEKKRLPHHHASTAPHRVPPPPCPIRPIRICLIQRTSDHVAAARRGSSSRVRKLPAHARRPADHRARGEHLLLIRAGDGALGHALLRGGLVDGARADEQGRHGPRAETVSAV